MSKVLLIVPTHNYKHAYPSFLSVSDFPAGYAYIAASLKEAGHEVFGLNLNNIIGYPTAKAMITDRITKKIEEIKPDLIGMGGLCIDYAFLRDAIGIIRKVADLPIVLGGGIINNDAEFVFNLLKPDFCILGDGEETMVKLASAIEGNKDYTSIDNIGYWEGEIKFTKRNFSYGDINERPFPDYEPFDIMDMLDNYSPSTRVLYRYPRPYARPMIIVTARGCPFHCTFCVSHPTKYRARSIENIMAEIAVNYERYNFNVLLVQDELFAVNKQRMKDFCNELIANKRAFGWDFSWMFQTHPNAKLDLETLQLAKEAGCCFFSYGLESASPTVLKSMNKKSDISQIIEALRLADEVGLGFGGNLLFGDFAETEDTIRESMEFYFKYGFPFDIFLVLVIPYPGSKIFNDCIEKGIIKDKLKYYEMIDEHIVNMTSMSDTLWMRWAKFFAGMEQSYMMIKSVNATGYKEDIEESQKPLALYHKKPMVEVFARCPFCGKEFSYKEFLNKENADSFMVIGCQHCNKRVRINLVSN